MNVWDSGDLNTVDREAGLQSSKDHVLVNAVRPGSTVSLVSVPRYVHPAESGKPITERNSQSIYKRKRGEFNRSSHRW